MKVEVVSDCRNKSSNTIINQIFKDRNIDNPDHFLNPTVDDMLPLDSMPNIVEAANKVMNAIGNGYKIGILADTDSDGISSGAIMYRYLKKIGADVYIFIDHGKQHGLQKNDLDKYKDIDFLIVVDSLDSNCYLYEELKVRYNIEDIIVLDHHVINEKIPYDKYVILVSSQRDYDNKHLSGAGVAWKFCLLMDMLFGFNYANDLVDLAGVGIIADMMDITIPENRYIVSEALKEIHNPCIKKIVGGFDWNSTAVAFSLAPAINASNRLDKNEDALNAFICDDNKDVLKYVKVMKSCKDQQNEEIDNMMHDIEKQCQQQLDKKMIIIEIETEHGIAGLIGNKLLEKYKRPLLIVKDQDDLWSGSMRAIGVDDFRKMLNDSKLAKSYGHELAASVTFLKKDKQALIDYMEEHLPNISDFQITLNADIRLNIDDIDKNLINKIKELDKISGTGFKPIKIYIDGITDYEVSDMSNKKHLVIKPNGSNVNFIKWNWNGNWEKIEECSLLGEELEAVVSLDSGWLGRNFMLKAICDYIGVKNE